MSFGVLFLAMRYSGGLLPISLENKKLMELGTNVLYCDFGSYGGTSSNGINVSTFE